VSLLGLDLGEKRVGVAVAEPPAYVAVPLAVLAAEPWEEFMARLRALAAERGVRELVAGLPVQTDGKEGAAALAARELAQRIAAALQLPLSFQDERYTSNEATQALAASRPAWRRRKRHRDALAAALILDTYLRRRSGETG